MIREARLPNLNYRKAGREDVQGIESCIDAAYSVYADKIADLPDVSGGVATDIVQDHVWVALSDQQIVGVAIAVHAGSSMKLANIAVDPNFSGRGIAAKLFELVTQKAAQLGCREIVLNTHAEMTGNLGLYAHWGFAETGREGDTVSLRKVL